MIKVQREQRIKGSSHQKESGQQMHQPEQRSIQPESELAQQAAQPESEQTTATQQSEQKSEPAPEPIPGLDSESKPKHEPDPSPESVTEPAWQSPFGKEQIRQAWGRKQPEMQEIGRASCRERV